MAALSNIGLGSNGALSYDIIEQLREVDNSGQIAPIDRKLATNSTKLSDLSILTTLTASFKMSTSTLSDEMSYLKRSSTVSGDSIDLEVQSGTNIQDFSIDVKNLATRDIFESKSFLTKTSTFTTVPDTLTFSVDGEDYDIDVNSSTTLESLKNDIYDATDGKIEVSLLNVGGDNPYKLIIKSEETGKDNAISISSTNGAALDLGFSNYTYEGTTPTGTYDGTLDDDLDGTPNGDDTLVFNIGGVDRSITVTNGDSITEIQSKIETDLSDVLKVEIVDGKLVLESLDENMSVSSTFGSDVIFGLDSMPSPTQNNHIQTATNALFEYSGVEIDRASNKIEDLIVGVTINLKETGSSNVTIKQDTSDITANMESFVSKYNELTSNLNELTKYDIGLKTAGTFQGISEITSMKTDINRLLQFSDTVPRTEKEIEQLLEEGAEDGLTRSEISSVRTRNLQAYGISLNSAGMLEFDSSKFDSMLSSDSKDVESFFRGTTTYDTTFLKGSNVNAGAIDLAEGDFSINGTNITLSLNGTASENAIALKSAIISANISGIEVSLDDTNSYINLTSKVGEDISIGGNSIKLASIGLEIGIENGSSKTSEGVFSKFNDQLKMFISGDTATLNLFEDSLNNQQKLLSNDRIKTVERLDAKYSIMATKFAAYDSVIGKLNNQFESLSMMIEASYADN